MKFETASATLRGDRELNQDRHTVIDDDAGDTVLLLLSDGMGGHPRGEVAAQIMVDTGRTAFNTTSKPIADPLGFLDDILRVANEEITAFGDRQDPPIDPRATAVAALVQDGTAYWSHVGDSRLYLFRDHEVITRTQDHSFAEQLRRRGMLEKAERSGKRVRNLVTQCLGGRGMRFGSSHGRPIKLRSRDLLLICSDGLWGQLQEKELLAQLRHHGSLKRMVRDLARAAEKSAAPASDNVTVVALRWLGRETRELFTIPASTFEMPGNGEQIPATEEEEDLLQAIEHLRSAIDEFESD